MIKRPALRYHGGKWQIGKKIMSHFPEHKVYAEPFGGGAGIMLQKPASKLDVYNDLNGDVVNFFQVLRNHEKELIRDIELTPYSREECLLAVKEMSICEDPIERARLFYTWSWQGRSRAGVRTSGGWRFMRGDNRHPTTVQDWNNMGHLWDIAAKIKSWQIEQMDALKFIKTYDGYDTLFYVDPPYVVSSRGKKDGKLKGKQLYVNDFSDEQHIMLSDLLHNCKASCIVSGYHSDLYDKLYDGWETVEIEVSKDNDAGKAIEVLWLSPNIKRNILFPGQ